MQNENKSDMREGHPEECRCGMCGWNHMGMHRRHIIGKVVVLALVFSFGFAVGGLHESHERGWEGRGYMHGGMTRGGYSDYQSDQGNDAAIPEQGGVRVQMIKYSTTTGQ